MKYNKDWKVEFSWEPVGSYRYYYWRIAKQELNFFQRIFCNPWRRLEHKCCDEWNPCISPTFYKENIQPIKTYGDILRYEESEWAKISETRKRLIEIGSVFPDEYD